MASIVNERDRLLSTSSIRVLPTGGTYIYISAPAQYFKVNNNGTSDQESIVFTANLVGNIYGVCTFSVVSGTATLVDSGINQTTLYFSDLLSDSVTIQASLDFFGSTYTAEFTVSRLTNGIVGSSAPVVSLTSTGQIFTVLKNTGAITPANNLITATAINVPSPEYAWYVDSVLQPGQNSPTFTVPSFVGDPKTVRVEVTSADTPMVFDQITMYSVREGYDSVNAGLENENQTISCDAQGVPLTGQFPISSKFVVYRGASQLTSGVAYTKILDSGLTSTIDQNTGVISVSEISALTAIATYRATITNLDGTTTTLDRSLTLNKSINGATGLNAAVFSITTSGAVFTKNSAKVISPSTGIILSTQYQNFTGTIAYKWQKNGVDISGATNLSYTVPTSDYSSVTTNKYKCFITGTLNGIANTTLSDEITIPLLEDGESSVQVINSNENITFTAPNSGYTGIVFTGGSCSITVYIGTTQLSYGTSGPYTFSCTRTGSGVTVASGVGTGKTFTLPAPTAISSETAYSDITVSIRNAAGVTSTVTSRTTYSLSRSGLSGSNGVDARSVNLTTNTQSFEYNPVTGQSPTPVSATITATPRNTVGTVFYEFLVNGTVARAYSTSNSYVYTPSSSFDNMPSQVQVNIKEGSGTTPTSSVLATDTISMIGLKAGTPGNDGVSPIVGFLTNEAATISADKNGVVAAADLAVAGGTFKVYEGVTDKTTLATFSVVSQTGISVTITATGASAGVYVVNSMSADNGLVTLRARYNNVNIDRIFNVTKSRAGQTGEAAKSMYLTATSQVFQISKTGTVSPATGITLTAVPSGGLTGTAVFSITSGTATLTSAGTNINTLAYNNMATDSVTVKATITDAGISYTDYITIVKVREGSDALNAILTNENVSLPADANGTVSSYASASTEIKIYQGATDVTSQWTISRVNGTGVLSTIVASTVTVTSLTADSANITINATKGTQTLSKIFSLSRTRAGGTGTTGPRNAQVYYYYNTASATAPTAQTATQVAYNFSNQSATTTATGWSSTFSPGTVMNATSASNKYWAQKVVFQESVFGGAYTATVTPVFTWQNMDGLVTFTNLATNKNSQGVNATFIDGGSIITGTLTADKISSGVATLSDPILPGSFAFGDTSPTILGNTRAVGKFVVNSNNGWAFSAINNFTGTTGEWANGGFFATRAPNGAALGGYSVVNQYTDATNMRTAFVCGEHTVGLYSLTMKESSYTQTTYSTNMNPVHRISDGFLSSKNGAAGGTWWGQEDARYDVNQNVYSRSGFELCNNNAAFYLYANHLSGTYYGKQRGLIQMLPEWAGHFAIHIASPTDNPAFINAGIRSPGGVTPFTGVHETQSNVDFEIGDILVDKLLLNKSGISNTHYEVELSSLPGQKTVIGICSGSMSNSVYTTEVTPDYETVYNSGGVVSTQQVYKPPMKQAWMLENTIYVNALGEGQINVCGENGNIEAGDLIITSSIPGKGMKQDDNIIRNITVAKSRESVVFSGPNDIKQIACIYMCG